ncbi:hypothetical protein [Cobetia sp. MC34]|uniref:hypothetical protein n=1 Tax=Cobetia sp. MC34 TaxID=2785080 RepID=UPI001BCA520F|nr:hypothetical protein [Cobetia sp. MC34]MBS4155509.1 hypothetical protein [Cobetia sp. MC34]
MCDKLKAGSNDKAKSLHFSEFDNILGDNLCNVRNIDVNENSEVIKIIRSYSDLELSIVEEFYTSRADVDQIRIEHPIYSNVDTYGVYSFMVNMTNFVVFTDSECNPKYTWVLGQVISAVSAILLEGKVIHGINLGEAEVVIKSLSEFKQDLTEVEYIRGHGDFSGFLLSNNRPYHYVYDSLYWAYFYQKNIPSESRNYSVYANNPFISLLHEGQYIPNKNGYYFKMCGLTRNLIRAWARKSGDSSWHNEDVREFEKWIYDTNVDFDIDNLSSRNISTFKLWIGITGQKRSWLQQVEGYSEIINRLSDYFDDLTVFVDGWTSPLQSKEENKEDTFIFEEIRERITSKNTTLVSLIGETYPTKIQACKDIDFHISVGGTGAFIPLRICKKPGVIHCNRSLNTFDFDQDKLITFIADKNIIEAPIFLHGKIVKTSMNISYSASWQLMYNCLIDFIKTSKGIFFGYQETSSVAEISSSHAENHLYTAENKAMLAKLFEDTSDLLKSDTSLPDILISLSNGYEECGDIVAALKMIRLAKVFRPKGARILKKEKLYLELLS